MFLEEPLEDVCVWTGVGDGGSGLLTKFEAWMGGSVNNGASMVTSMRRSLSQDPFWGGGNVFPFSLQGNDMCSQIFVRNFTWVLLLLNPVSQTALIS